MEKIFDIAKDSEKSWGVIAQGIDRNFEELSNEAQESNTASHISKVVSSSIMPTIIENKQVTVDGIRDASIQNYAEIDVSIFTDGILRVTALNDVELRRTNRGFREPVWIIGDSYCSTDNNERWPYYLLNEYKIKSWFLIALAGQTSNDLNGHVGAYNDLLNALQYGTPKYLWYQIQANDTNAVYEEYIYKIKDICDKRGITLILVRHAKLGEQAEGKDWQTKNSIALSLGLRYVDMYKAVTGNELTHDWYEGYLSSDGVHPTALGAKAEAMRILCDIPEITQYN